jgi:hypothetical protein
MNGSWGSNRVEYTEWNLQLIERMVDDMSPWWVTLNEEFVESLEDVNTIVTGGLDALVSEVKGREILYIRNKVFSHTNAPTPDFQGAPLFAETIRTKMESVAYTFADTITDAKKRLEYGSISLVMIILSLSLPTILILIG